MTSFKNLLMGFVLLSSTLLFGQNTSKTKWWNPKDSQEPVVFNQGWSEGLASIYHRLPQRAKALLRPRLWELSTHSAGLSLRFKTNARQIKVRYKTKGKERYEHIPLTGIRGLDLYFQDEAGQWQRTVDFCSLSNPCSYDYVIDKAKDPKERAERVYKLLLPLYDEVLDLKIGVEEKASFQVLSPKDYPNSKTIVAYGTSICQGACASRAGMSWTNILERRLDCKLINLGFSGNGKLETPIIDLMCELKANLYILDCLPNLRPDVDDVYTLTLNAVHKLKTKHPQTPIILTAHIGYANAQANQSMYAKVQKLNGELLRAFEDLRCYGVEGVYLLRQKALNLGLNSYVDYIHPNDYGMLQYAEAYEQMIEAIGLFSSPK